MRIHYPTAIPETIEALEEQERRLRGTRAAVRVRMLLLLKNEAAKSLKDVAPLLGYSLVQVTRWWKCYTTQCLDALIEQHPHPGKPSQMTQDAWAGLEQVMIQGKIRTLEEARQYLEREWHISYKSANGVWDRFKQRKVKWKTGRRRHRRASQEQQDTFKKNFAATIATLQVEQMVALDEGRFGLKNWFHRRWCPKGIRPPYLVDDRYESFWLYAAVEPTTGAGHFLLLPDVTGDCLEIFLQHLRQELGTKTIGMVLDSSGSHHSSQVAWPHGMKPLYLPPYSPELNPTEQIFRHLRKKLSNRLFSDLEELQTVLIDELHLFWEQPTVLLSLTGYPWWQEGVQSNLSLSP